MALDQQMPTPPQDEVASTPGSQNWLGVVALVTGIVGLGVPALVFGILGLRAVRDKRASRRGAALAGVILGSVWIVVSVVVTVVLVLVTLSARGNASAPTSGPVSSAAPERLLDPADATRFVLAPDAASDPALLEAAAAYLASRVDAKVGVDDARSTIVVDFGGEPAGQGAVDELTRPSDVQLRPVVLLAGPEPSSGDWPSATASSPSWAGDPDFFATETLGTEFDRTSCAARAAGGTARPDAGAVACQVDGSAKYLLGASVASSSEITGVEIDGTTVTLTLDDDGARAVRDLTTRLAAAGPPNNQFAVVADGAVVTAPTVSSPVTAGVANLSGADRQSALLLAGALTYGSPLMTLSVQSATS